MNICEVRDANAPTNMNDLSDAKFVFKDFDLTEIKIINSNNHIPI